MQISRGIAIVNFRYLQLSRRLFSYSKINTFSITVFLYELYVNVSEKFLENFSLHLHRC